MMVGGATTLYAAMATRPLMCAIACLAVRLLEGLARDWCTEALRRQVTATSRRPVTRSPYVALRLVALSGSLVSKREWRDCGAAQSGQCRFVK
jgi:hypothetical protein